MPNRATLLVAVLACAIAIPYFADRRGQGLYPVRDWWSSMFHDESIDEGLGDAGYTQAGGNLSSVSGSANGVPGAGLNGVAFTQLPPFPRSPQGPQFQSLSQVFRFDISPAWVTSTWPLVSHVLGDHELAGMRLPLVGGTRPQDLTGSLTYWFNSQQQCERIEFSGATAAPAEIIGLASQGYGLRAEPSLGGSLFVAKSATGVPQSLLRVRNARQLVTRDPERRYDVELELQRPGSSGQLSRQIVERMGREGIRIHIPPAEKAAESSSQSASTGPDQGGSTLSSRSAGQGGDKDGGSISGANTNPASPTVPVRRRPDTEFLLPRNR